MAEQPDILVLNTGSSSIKFNLYEGERQLISGQISGLGVQPHIHFHHHARTEDLNEDLSAEDGASHEAALETLLAILERETGKISVEAIGHRVVHGGADFAAPLVLDDEKIDELARLSPLAPLHQPHNLAGIRASRATFPKALQVACFDTAFHRHHPWVNDTFALPRSYYDEGIRRYGFHGLSYEYICSYLQDHHVDAFGGKLVVAHLGNGASMCAIENGRSIGSTMGFTALDGLPMGTRCGQLDPGVVLYLLTTGGMTTDEVTHLLYEESGLKGLSGLSQDMRLLSESTDPAAAEAIDYFVFRIRRELGSMAAILRGLDTLVFTGGIGEHSALVRKRVCEDQDWLGMKIDPDRNATNANDISSAASRVRIMAVPTNEEEMIRRHTLELFEDTAG